MKRLLLLLICFVYTFFILLSCEKKNYTIVTGVVIDSVKNIPAVNQKVIVVSCYYGNFLPVCGNLVTETRTNANGEFTLRFESKKNPIGYEARAGFDDNKYYYSSSNSETVLLDQENNFTFYARELGYLKAFIKTDNNPFKHMVISSGNSNHTLLGSSFDTSLIFKILPNANNKIIFSVWDTTIGKYRTLIDTLQIGLRDTTFYNRHITDSRNFPVR